MSSQHTMAHLAAGTMLITMGGAQSEYHVVGIEGTKRAVAITGKCGDQHDALSAADASRLAASWNACQGLTQDHFDGGWTALGLSKHAKRQEDKRATARALLEGTLPLIVQVAGGGAMAERIREFLKEGAA
ncbi:MAG: hypothetical protein K2X55_02190 [Burkholderiaceae bacterium]|nr:hypothetical protein [Burkholderiaceae bacterium]